MRRLKEMCIWHSWQDSNLHKTRLEGARPSIRPQEQTVYAIPVLLLFYGGDSWRIVLRIFVSLLLEKLRNDLPTSYLRCPFCSLSHDQSLRPQDRLHRNQRKDVASDGRKHIRNSPTCIFSYWKPRSFYAPQCWSRTNFYCKSSCTLYIERSVSLSFYS